MLRKISTNTALFSSLVVAAVILTGCGKTETGSAQTETATEAATVDDGGWWCDEHGVPEEECALCDPTLVAKFKADGDWCEEHNRPESHCFECSPARFDKFATRYEAKFGVKPPKPTE
jgi:hypothetical protein